MPKIRFEIEKGRLGADPEISFLKDNTCMAKLSIASNQYFKNDDGEWEQKGETSWINGVSFGYTAECIESLELEKGDEVFVKGTMETDIWEDDEGEERKSWNFYINQLFRVPRVEFEEEEEDDRPRKSKGRKSSSRRSSKKSSSRSSKRSGSKRSSRKSSKKSSGKSYAEKVLAQLKG